MLLALQLLIGLGLQLVSYWLMPKPEEDDMGYRPQQLLYDHKGQAVLFTPKPPNQGSGGRRAGISPPTPRIPPKPVSCPGCGAWGTHQCDYCGNVLPYTYDVPKSK